MTEANEKQLVPYNPYNTYSVPGGEPICTINIAGYSLDNYKTVNFEGYTMVCHFGKITDGFSYFPETSKLVLDTNQYNLLINNFNAKAEQWISNVAQDLKISEEVACKKGVDFLADTEITVEPTGIQGKAYKMLLSAQNLIPMAYASEAASALKTSGLTGLKLISKAPLTFVGATYVGAVFFSYCGSIAGDNPVGLIFNSTSYLLSRPMRGVEITLNGLILRPISNVIGLPLILNGTQTILAGKGLSIEEYKTIAPAFTRIANSKVVKKAKEVYKILRSK